MIGWLRGVRLEDELPGLADEIASTRRQVAGQPLWIAIPLAVGLLVAGSLLCGGILVLFERSIDPLVLGVLGGIALALSVAGSWAGLPWLVRPFVLVLSVVGRGLLWGAFGDLFHDLPFVAYASLEIAIGLVHRDPLQRWFSAFAAPLMLTDGESVVAQGLVLPVLGAGAGIAVTRRHWARFTHLADFFVPVSSGLLVSALVLACLPGKEWYHTVTLAIGVAGAVVAVLVASAAEATWPERIASGLVPLAVCACTVGVPGVPVAVLVACVGFLVGSPATWTAGVGGLVAYAVWFYFNLELPLYEKGGAMIALGAVCVASGWFAGRGRSSAMTAKVTVDRAGAAWVVLGATVASMLVVGQSVLQEARVATAEVVFLPLAPRDPRSLVQGDYHALRYAVGNDIATHAGSERRGEVVLAVDVDRVATFARMDDGERAPGERRVRWWTEDGQSVVTSNAWLFEEGTGAQYSTARFGIVALTEDGGALLVGLADENRVRIGPQRTLW